MRFQTNDYSVPVACGYHQGWVRGYVEQVVIGFGAQIIARHRRGVSTQGCFVHDLAECNTTEGRCGWRSMSFAGTRSDRAR